MATLAELVAELRRMLASISACDMPRRSACLACDDDKQAIVQMVTDAAEQNERLRALLGEALPYLDAAKRHGHSVDELTRSIEAELRAQRKPEVERDDGSDEG
jgi:hypothetical protein